MEPRHIYQESLMVIKKIKINFWIIIIINYYLPKILIGFSANSNSWPWQVALIIDGNRFCAGSLIFNQWIVTAAHCVGYYFDLIENSLFIYLESFFINIIIYRSYGTAYLGVHDTNYLSSGTAIQIAQMISVRFFFLLIFILIKYKF